MPSSYTDLLRLTKPADGELVGTWGQVVNNGVTELEEDAIAGTAAVPVTNGADTVLTTANGAADQARAATLNLTGALTAQRNVICPSTSKTYYARNNTTGGFGVQIKTAAGTGVVVPAGGAALVYCDGVNVVHAVTAFGPAVGNTLFADGTVALPGIAFTAEPSSGFSRSAAGIRLSVAGQLGQQWSPAGNVSIGGAPTLGYTLRLGKDMTGALSVRGVVVDGAIQSDATSSVVFNSGVTTAAGPVVLSSLTHYQVSPPALGAGSSVATQVGFLVSSITTGAGTNRAFQSNIDAAADRWNLYMSGTAANFLAGNLYVGMNTPDTVPSLSALPYKIQLLGNASVDSTMMLVNYQNGSSSTSLVLGKSRGAAPATPVIVANNDTLGTIRWVGSDGVALQEAARILGYVSGVPAVGNVPGGLYFQTSAVGVPTTSMQINAAGEVGIPLAVAGSSLRISKPQTGAANTSGVFVTSIIQSDSVTAAYGFASSLTTAAAVFTIADLIHFRANAAAPGAGSIVTNAYGFRAESTVGFSAAVNAYGFYGNMAAAAGRWNLYMGGAAANFLAGNLYVGMDTPETYASISATPAVLQLLGNSVANTALAFGMYNASATIAGSITFGKSRGSSPLVQGIVANGELLGTMRFDGNDGVKMVSAARIQSVIDGVPALDFMPAAIRFQTSPGVGPVLTRLLLTAIGDVINNVNTAVPALTVNNQMVFNLTSNTNLRVSVRGTDGVTRKVDLTLAP